MTTGAIFNIASMTKPMTCGQKINAPVYQAIID
jgi:hypothetical protein